MQRTDNNITLPEWLDGYIFDNLGAIYCRSNTDMTVIDWDKSEVLNYLGTYFPRSYAESYCIFTKYLTEHKNEFSNQSSISIFDFCCGTGGEIFGLLSALIEQRGNIKQIEVVAFDGNHSALRLYEKVMQQFRLQTQVDIKNRVIPDKIDDLYDLSILDEVLETQKFDIIISFKAVCEFVTKQCFEKNNPYENVFTVFSQRLLPNGIMLFVDITSFNDVSQEWLPNMMDRGIKRANCEVVSKNPNYNQTFKVSHSKKYEDRSKVAWRLIKK